ncbi:potassium-transporting ATPase subunit KdpC [Crenothrix polyspora]|uniref:Potassium-transporting ATPase KdpC subunit n=1 Tax=Crenothrix polyspora TaxID=360316 RepID=A0A1R4HD07_9GAMM|nr:potassium-transporting ATPase subunit KdpC [Crenothrix polyspora]SJM94097.1 potassium translocating ATPase, subunit C [Crenothrix polyspora]
MMQHIKPALFMLLFFTVLTGIAYPLLVTFGAQILFPAQANGSLIVNDKHTLGSELIGQSFTRPEYFWGRPSATSSSAYNAAASSGSNLGPSNPNLRELVQQRIKVLRELDPSNTQPIPVDLVTASASGLDPHISSAAVLFQLNRVAAVRHLPLDKIEALVTQCTEARQLGVLGEPRVNILRLNLALDNRRSCLE